MDTHSNLIGALVERAEQYGRTNVEIFKLKAIGKSSDFASSLLSKLIVAAFFILCFLILNAGIALWIGELLGRSYFGFFALASFYAITGIVLFAFRDRLIKNPMRNSIITNILN